MVAQIQRQRGKSSLSTLPHRYKSKPMPSVEMRRSTRVFGARVLRSGKRMRTESHDDGKYTRAVGGGGGDGVDIFNENRIDIEPKIEENALEVRNKDKICGIVYRRKRRVVESNSGVLLEDKRFKKKFVRRQWKKEVCNRTPLLVVVVANKSSYDGSYWISCFLFSVLSYMTRARIGIQQLSAFVLTEPIFGAYSSGGMLFYQDPITVKRPGSCIIWESSSLIPVFTLDFSVIPSCFIHIHTNMYLRSLHLAQLLVPNCFDSDVNNEDLIDVVVDYAENDSVSQSYPDPGRELSHSAVGLPKYPIGVMQLRSRRTIRKRSSLRRKRGRPCSAIRPQKAPEALASGFFRIRHKNIKELKPPVGVIMDDKRFTRCVANLLVIEPDRCYREGGVIITLELDSAKWSLAVIKDGKKRYSLTAQKVMMPSYSNRFTHATVWTESSGWKLEFPNKQDWFIFKELYKECSDRNMHAPSASEIPIPGVQELPIEDNDYTPYVRPESYITVEHDELTRAMVKNSVNYDMDSDDGKWLDKFNDQLYVEQQVVTPETFELVIDALEKGSHGHQDYYSEKQTTYELCMHLERKEVVEGICNYWIKKRKHKRAALVRIFQLYQPRRTEVIPNSVLRKKRSFKRQASQNGRGNQRTFMHAMVAERHKVQEAKATANRSDGLSVLKRQRAQILMENADLVTYKAIMALKIAETAKATKDSGMVASFFLG